ncbi:MULTISPECIES: putative 4-hydroxy-4-methyl-2-oxoglutarate aldolase [unclassified Shewanella]|uniref:putative 4-hydroxy-4-methyl-2-oxoglutarate aldolase n=1 Tax=unclassified Shewanella TaxID=196818 RepID=UPI001BC7DAE6|nr:MULTISPECIES: putative 4-hydroxy-4-methyl-2-oxoglutarate aldolase [unclassified Shewanella]GIU16003.1 putative 4-hydroxy-4-methyl-2-oxoglutarate aldolase [Shewanella sp. MBTL60-112-B1]GIU33919.1 putative 4-hydroxy-4-methyl-2-oxoglutarate aldolase [Shewanella sp. MBTL60-112-B2]
MLDLLPDLFDAYGDKLTLLPPMFISYGKQECFWGEVVTVKCYRDNSKVKELLAQDGRGKVLVVDGQGGMDCALLGDMIAQSAADNGWNGVVILGCVRDVGALKTIDLGIQAIGANPIKTVKKGIGEVNIAVEIYGVIISPHSFIYADGNGVALSNEALDISVLNL